jgi:RNA polymerase sigma-70 factor (ECF subfamily)
MPGADPTHVRHLYDKHSRDLFAYLARRVGRDLAEDLLAETFRVLIESYGTYDRQRGSERMWLYGIATNLVRRHWRTEQRRLLTLQRAAAREQSSIDPLLTLVESAAGRVDAQHEAACVLEAVVALSPDDRDLLILSGWEHLNSTEIGRVLDVPPATVRSRLRRLRSELQTSIRPTPGVNDPSPTGAAS